MENVYKNYNTFSNTKRREIKNKKELRVKLTKVSNNFFKPRCEHYLNNMRAMNLRILEFSGGKKSIEKEAKESRNFRFGKMKDYFKHLTDLSQYNIEFSPFISYLKQKFTQREIDNIKKNKDYYILNALIKDNVSLFADQSLYQVLNKEERDEEIAKANIKVDSDQKISANSKNDFEFSTDDTKFKITNGTIELSSADAHISMSSGSITLSIGNAQIQISSSGIQLNCGSSSIDIGSGNISLSSGSITTNPSVCKCSGGF